MCDYLYCYYIINAKRVADVIYCQKLQRWSNQHENFFPKNEHKHYPGFVQSNVNEFNMYLQRNKLVYCGINQFI